MIPPVLNLTSSRINRYWLAGLHLAAALLALLLPLLWCLSVVLVVLLHFYWQRRPVPCLDFLQVLPEGDVDVVWCDGERRKMVVQPSSVITSWLIVLHLAGESGTLYLTLWPDSAERDALRQWRVWLRWQLPALRRRKAKTDDDQ